MFSLAILQCSSGTQSNIQFL